jgi:hypothetical protein
MTHEMTMPWLVLLGLGAFHGINPGMGWLFAVALGLQERHRSGVLAALLPLGLGHALAVAAALAIALLLGVIVPLHYLRWIVAGILIPLGISRLFRHRHPRWASMQVGMGRLTLWSFLMASAHGAGLMVVPVFLGMSPSSAPMPHHQMESMLPTGASMPSPSSVRAESIAPALSASVEMPIAPVVTLPRTASSMDKRTLSSVSPLATAASLASPTDAAATPLAAPGSANPADKCSGTAVALLATALHSLGYLLVTALLALLFYEKLGFELLRKAWFNLDLLWAVSLIATGLAAVLV